MRGEITILRVDVVLDDGERERLLDGLTEVLADCVAGGASVNFMAPLDPARARGHWIGALDGVVAGSRALLVAIDGATDRILGTVQVVPATPENQPHRGELTKLLVHRGARRRGVGDLLMAAAEDVAVELGLTLLVLDTASADAERVYERRGWQRVGTIEGYALLPDGDLCDATIFCKHLG